MVWTTCTNISSSPIRGWELLRLFAKTRRDKVNESRAKDIRADTQYAFIVIFVLFQFELNGKLLVFKGVHPFELSENVYILWIILQFSCLVKISRFFTIVT